MKLLHNITLVSSLHASSVRSTTILSVLLLFLYFSLLTSCRKKEPGPELQDWKYLGDVGVYNYLRILEDEKMLIPTASYGYFTHDGLGYKYMGLDGIEQPGSMSLSPESTELRGHYHHQGTDYILYEDALQEVYSVMGIENNFFLTLISILDNTDHHWEQICVESDSVMYVLGYENANTDLAIAKIYTDGNNSRKINQVVFPAPDVQLVKRMMPIDAQHYLIIYEDNGNGYQERDIAFRVVDSSLQTIAESRLALSSYQEFGGAIIQNGKLVMSGHTSDQEPNHDYFLAKFSLSPSPQLTEIKRYGGAHHDGSTALAYDDQYYALAGITSELGQSTTSIKLVDKNSLELVSETYLDSTRNNYPLWAELYQGDIYIAGYEIGEDTKQHRMLARKKLY